MEIIIISIITINYNGLKDTCELIESLPLEDKSIEVIVVDNASEEDEATIITNRYPQVKVIRSEKNLGFAGGNNLGIKAAQGKYLFFINNDVILKPQTSDIRHLISRLETDDKIGAVCPKIRFAWDDYPIQFAGYTPLSRYTMRNRSIGFGETDKGQYDTAHQTPYAHGAAMMVKREVLEKVGLMPECYFLYYEELDWSMMFTRAGYAIWYEPACTIYHKESQATGQNSPLKTYYLTRNRLLFVKRNIQGLRRYITYTYLLLVVAPRDICRYIMHRQFNLASATIKGIINYQLSIFNYQFEK
ncbi:glycosyltransferase family 2 protein [Prevotella communis]|nr:glycosyltransferase family 2 protein [Prevotella communis]UKK63566.1 glycosyltransferase family 2 protein [Prevotella communis]UKK66392.1 glycosyltransferase family 2 protein [Prevotella communis]